MEQARLIAAYMGEEEPADDPADPDAGRTAFYLTNNSPEPVYSVVVGMVFVQGAAPRTLGDMMELNRRQYQRLGAVTTVSILPGGLYRVWVNGVGWSAIPGGRAGLDIAFMDRAGASWFRTANGGLEELGKPVLDYFFDLGLAGPYDLQTPERVDGR